MCFLKLCRPSEMPQSLASCWTLHCFMHVWWVYISLDGNFCALNHLIERLLICKVIHLILIQLIFSFGNTFVLVLIGGISRCFQ